MSTKGKRANRPASESRDPGIQSTYCKCPLNLTFCVEEPNSSLHSYEQK